MISLPPLCIIIALPTKNSTAINSFSKWFR
jgi:hypothetical protein